MDGIINEGSTQQSADWFAEAPCNPCESALHGRGWQRTPTIVTPQKKNYRLLHTSANIQQT